MKPIGTELMQIAKEAIGRMEEEISLAETAIKTRYSGSSCIF